MFYPRHEGVVEIGNDGIDTEGFQFFKVKAKYALHVKLRQEQ